MLICYFPEFVYLLYRVFVLHRFYREVDFLLKAVTLVIEVIFWDRPFDLLAQSDARLIGPAPGYVLDCVTPASQQNCRQSICQHVLQAISMSLQA